MRAHLSPELDLELEDITKPLNAFFEEISYDDCQVKETDYGVAVTVSGTYSGYWLDDNNDDLDDPVIDLEITVYLPRCAGSVSFDEPQVDVVGTLREDDAEEEESEQPAAAMS